jgi:hypothetical protein
VNIQIPSDFTANAIYDFIGKIINNEGSPVADLIEVDFARLNWIDAAGVTIISNIFEWLNKRNVICRIRATKYNSAIRYLDDCGFFRMYCGAPIKSSATLRPTTLPLQRVSHEKSYSWLVLNLIPWLATRLRVSCEELEGLSTDIREIFNNIKDHSGETIGCIFVQYYPNIEEVRIVLSDFGVGIPTTMRRIRGFESDGAAILEATVEGVTSQSRTQNFGLGLPFILNDVIKLGGGRVEIRSLNGILNCKLGSGGEIVRQIEHATGTYPGTFIEMVFPRHGLKNIDDEAEPSTHQRDF